MNDVTIQLRVRAAMRGDAHALSSVFQVYRPSLYAHALRLVGNPGAHDVVQDTFISAMTHVSSLRSEQRFYPWLRKILINNCFIALRVEKSLNANRMELPDDVSIEESIAMSVDDNEVTQHVHHALNNLSTELRSCVLLRYFGNFHRYEDIATILDVPIGTVRSRLAAAREKLARLYSHDCDVSNDVLRDAHQWSEYYTGMWNNLYDHEDVRQEFIQHLLPDVHVRFTSGSTRRGRAVLESELHNDLVYGSRLVVKDAYGCGNVTVLEGVNVNSAEFPDRCAPSTVIVFTRNESERVISCNIHDSPRIVVS